MVRYWKSCSGRAHAYLVEAARRKPGASGMGTRMIEDREFPPAHGHRCRLAYSPQVSG
jgi:hypothetical protein